jgi:glycosyltransferase involved in cell wall biosynthesis
MQISLASIVIPCFNSEACIGDAINSALQQTYPEVEVIVIDDGSTDGSLDIIKSFGDRIRWETGGNSGGGSARNRGIKLARGAYIQFLDADDTLHPTKLEKQILKSKKRENKISYCNYVRQCFNTGIELGINRLPTNGEDSILFVLMHQTIQTSAPIHLKKNLEAVGGFREELKCGQEYDLHLRLAMNGIVFEHFDEVLYCVRQRKESVSSDLHKVICGHEPIYSYLIDNLTQKNALDDRKRQAISHCFANDARILYRLGDQKKADYYLGIANRLHASGQACAYSRAALFAKRVVGPVLLERFVMLKRRLFTRAFRSP